MSAITGIVHFSNEPIAYRDTLALMQALRKFPADRIHTWEEGPVFMGCHAQWVTPESVQECLPYYDRKLRLAITADVILDNRPELFNRLGIEYDRRQSITDSELLLLGYRKWGQELPKYLIGEYAYMIWDEAKGQLFGARDLQGSRTLYYFQNHTKFIFCSALSPLFTQPDIHKEINDEWFAEFLAIPLMIDCTDIFSTVYRNIRQIPPGYSLTAIDGKVILTRYGSLVPEGTIRYKSDSDYVEAFRDVFEDAVNSKLRTYRKVGATLSGGLDSGAVVSVAAGALRSEGKQLHTYSSVPVHDFTDWTSNGDIADESPYIQATVRHVGNISPNYLDLPDKNPYSEIDGWLNILESPYKHLENSHWIKGIYEHAFQNDIGIMLTGAKGNFTISWGSALDYYALLLKRMRFFSFYRELTQFGSTAGVRRSKVVKHVGRIAFPKWFNSETNTACDIPSLIHPDYARKTNVFARLEDKDVGLRSSPVTVLGERQDYFNNLSVLNLQGSVASKLSLHYKVWERDPTCDPRVVRFCLSVPFEQYVRNGIGRSLVRRATEKELPDEVRLNVRNRGFQAADWVHRIIPSWNKVTEEIQHLCRDNEASTYLDIQQIQSSLQSLGSSPSPDCAVSPDAKVLMRSLIAYRFLKSIREPNSLKGGDTYAKESMGSSRIGST